MTATEKIPDWWTHNEDTGISGVWGRAPVWLRLCRVGDNNLMFGDNNLMFGLATNPLVAFYVVRFRGQRCPRYVASASLPMVFSGGNAVQKNTTS